jgi:hypothetical protein
MIVIFNGPPASGKDEAADLFKEHFGFKALSFKHQLFKETIEHFGVDKSWFMEGYNNRDIKEKKEYALGDRSRREAMIHVSEDVIKPKNGKSFFGWKVSQEIQEDLHYAIADGGFVEELEPVIEKVGSENVVIVQLTREGHDYSTDSRRYFNGNLLKEYTIGFETPVDKAYVLKEDLGLKTYRIHNNGTVRNFHGVLTKVFEELRKDYNIDSVEEQAEGNTETEHN